MSPRPEGDHPFVVELAEWDRARLGEEPLLKGISLAGNPSAQRLAEMLRERVDIREGYQGLDIATTSYVGRIDVGPLRIEIRPKLPSMPLARLLRYAYGLRDVTTLEETQAPTAHHGLHDLLMAMLAAEVEELLFSGLARRYAPISERLDSPRGRLLVAEMVRRGGITEARLPCRHFERRTDWQLNRVLRAGLDAAAVMTEDRELRRRVHGLAEMFGDVERLSVLKNDDVDRAEHGLTRLTAANAPALKIIRLLLDMRGVAFESTDQPSRMPGFLFDMNLFFQRLLSRFLHENLTAQRIEDERTIRNVFLYASDANPRRRSVPRPRPDFALFQDEKLCGFLDAKYRDNWERGLPAKWLYQLSIYALASPTQRSVLLYASMAADACDERVEIRQPISWSSIGPASVILRPVPLCRLAELLDPDRKRSLAAERQRFAESLVSFQTQARANKSKFSEARAA